MSLLVDTSVWSHAFHRDAELAIPAVSGLQHALDGADQVFTTGLMLQEPDREDHIEAAEVRNTCRRHGVQIGTMEAVLIQVSLKHDLVLISADNDFRAASRHIKFQLWQALRPTG